MPELAEFLAGQKLETNAVVQPIQRMVRLLAN